MTAPALVVARIDPTTGLPMRGSDMVGFEDLTQATARAVTLTNIAGHHGKQARYGVWRLIREYDPEVTFAPAPPPKPTETQVQP
jgi:hypothetical protein